jgi:hypothetical protein
MRADAEKDDDFGNVTENESAHSELPEDDDGEDGEDHK